MTDNLHPTIPEDQRGQCWWLLGEISAMLEAESKATTDYTSLADQSRTLGLPLLGDVFDSIQKDEDKHHKLLESIKEYLDTACPPDR